MNGKFVPDRKFPKRCVCVTNNDLIPVALYFIEMTDSPCQR